MAENDFLPFATGSAANVLSQSDYAALSALASGFTSGVAKSAAVNKVLRQSSIMSAVLASFIVQNAGTDVIDDGTTATIEANLTAALNALFITPSELSTALANYAAKNGSTANRFSTANAVAATDALNLGQAQSGAIEAAVASGTANAIVLTRTVPVTALTDQMKVRFKAVSANTGAVTLNDSGIGAKSLYGQGNVALVGGEIVSGGEYEAVYNSTAGVYQLVAQSGGSMQVAAAVASSQALTLGQAQLMFTPVLGATPRLSANVTVGATTATFTDDAITCATSLTGTSYRIAGFSASINLATTGIGGMDTGTATAGGFLAVYAAYNPTTKAYGVFGSMEGSVAPPKIYGGANLPSGYTATALIAVVPISSTAGQFNSFSVHGTRHTRSLVAPANTTTGPTTLTGLTLAGYVPKAARTVYGSMGVSAFTSAGSVSMSVATDANATNQTIGAAYAPASAGFTVPFTLTLITSQILYWYVSANLGTNYVGLSGYDI
ncbi:hypothetical protein ACQUFY_06720 [Robbsia andropogonis]|uniref:hypothetical protein n=1 Tax=Robbsia andropogonis TaxID=28092 RepID=UPI003D1FBD9F